MVNFTISILGQCGVKLSSTVRAYVESRVSAVRDRANFIYFLFDHFKIKLLL